MRRSAPVNLFALIILAILAMSTSAETVDRIDAKSLDTSDLVLNGVGVRRALFIELYTCELYLTTQNSDPEAILAADEPVAVALKVHGNPPGSLPEDWARVLRDELSSKLYSRVKERYKDLQEGDEVVIRYVSGLGTSVALNNERLFVDPGNSLMQSLLQQWLGEHPVSENLKSDLLGQ